MELDYLFNTIFAPLGYVFGFIGNLGGMQVDEFIYRFFLEPEIGFTFTNVITGAELHIPSLIGFLTNLYQSFSNYFREISGIGQVLFNALRLVFGSAALLVNYLGRSFLYICNTLNMLDFPAFVFILFLAFSLGIYIRLVRWALSFIPIHI